LRVAFEVAFDPRGLLVEFFFVVAFDFSADVAPSVAVAVPPANLFDLLG
jgi:hypothetical protein